MQAYRYLLWPLLFSMLLLSGPSQLQSENVNIFKRPFFSPQRVDEYIHELEKRRRIEGDNLVLLKQLYRSYFIAEKFVKGLGVIRDIQRHYQKKHETNKKKILQIDLDELKALVFSYQFAKAAEKSKEFVDKYKYFAPKKVELIRKQIPILQKKAEKLPAKSPHGSEEIWQKENRLMENLPLPASKIYLSPDGGRILARSHEEWYQGSLGKQEQNVNYKLLRVDDSRDWEELDWIQPAVGSSNYFYRAGGDIHFSFAGRDVKNNNKKRRYDWELWDPGSIKNKKGKSLKCREPFIASEGNYMVVSCRRTYARAPWDLYLSRLGYNRDVKHLVRLEASSDGDDVNPMISPDGRYLFFSSDGHLGYGGKDLFVSPIRYVKRKKGDKSYLPQFSKKVYNLGKRYNSFRDELKTIGLLPAKGQKLLLYRQSHKQGEGIFSAKLPSKYRIHPVKGLYLQVRNKDKDKAMGGEVSIIPRSAKDKRKKRIFTVSPFGSFLTLQKGVPYYLKAQKKGFLYYFDEIEASIEQDYFPIAMKTIKVGRTLNAKGILFHPSSDRLRAGADEAINPIIDLMKMNPKLRIRLDGHTSHIGAKQAQIMKRSIRLSEDRAFRVKKYITKRGVYPRRIKIKGFGPKRPLPDMPRSDGRNRRTEVRVISTDWDSSKEITPKVAFVDFFGKNKKSPYPFLKRSIPSALNTSMKDTGYVYNEVERKKWKRNIRDLRNDRLQRFCSVLDIEILIHGEYEVAGDLVFIYPKLYIANKNKNIPLPKVQTINRPDMFSDIDVIAKKISKVLDNYSRNASGNSSD